MQTFDSAGTTLAYDSEGDGPPVLLVHGFASNGRVNWVNPGWVRALVAAGRQAITFDHRGHGESEKLYDPADYRLEVMAEDAARLLDHLGIEQAGLIGYSMGARVSTLLALGRPDRVSALVLGGVGMNLVTSMRNEEAVASALLAEDPATVKDEPARGFRRFADRTRSDRKALAACMMAPRRPIEPSELARLSVPTLVAVGQRDEIAAGADEMAAMIPRAELLEIPDRDHMTVVGDARLIGGAVDFLARHA